MLPACVCAGSGKSHVAKLIRDMEKEQGGSCRVHCLDDYFLTVRLIWAPHIA